jgi:hypothetical protein
LEGAWEFVHSNLLVNDYELLKPLNKEDTARQLIRRYEDNLKLNMEKHLQPKLYQEDKYIRKTAKYHLSEMGPLAESFLRQGYNFLDKKLIMHCRCGPI